MVSENSPPNSLNLRFLSLKKKEKKKKIKIDICIRESAVTSQIFKILSCGFLQSIFDTQAPRECAYYNF